MKTINASVAQNSYASSYLESRRAYPTLDTRWLKRQESRSSRRQLDAQTRAAAYDGVHREAFKMAPHSEPSKLNVQKGQEHLFLLDPAKELRQRPVTVTIKRRLQRALQTIVMVPAV